MTVKQKLPWSECKLIEEPKSTRLKDLYGEELFFEEHGDSYTHYYTCPCGKGRVIDDKDATPGFRSRDIYIECIECDEKYEV